MLGEALTSVNVSANGSDASWLSGPATAVAVAALSAIILLSTLGNIMVLYVVFAHLRFRTVTNTFITTLSLTDLCSTAVCMPMALTTLVRRRWLFGNAGCLANGTINAALAVLSTIMITFITIDRYFVVVRLPKGRPLAVPSAVLAIGVACLLSIVIGAPWHMLSSAPPYYKLGYQHCNYILHIADSPYPGGPAFGSVFLLLCFVLPSACMIFCSISLWKIIHNNDSQIRPATAPASAIRFNGEMRTAKTVVIMVLLYLVSRVPYLLAASICGAIGVQIPVSVDTSLLWILWGSCAVNPIIYAFRNPTVAQFLRIGKRKSGYEAEKRLRASSPVVAHVEALSPRQFKYLPNMSEIPRSETASTEVGCSAAWEKDDRSDSIPSVLLFRTSLSSRKGSGLSYITTSTSNTNL
ncbi:hypothetical protein CAPTEDRAFT_123830 [Capitella teleta]|uniref:G-protein coupled receptors family 1 profile domain-containing protein n=1 Tax=Capitella teleta TaxID=283909 RepID=R7UXF8_CAPTE|nr:hypothetical protein CAPTEDRAFT_123830 [Capitella teleta]|eukprot:ELU10982.1 hypothetical protein CAPTEDRAFT_123830 [Capitella teleta]